MVSCVVIVAAASLLTSALAAGAAFDARRDQERLREAISPEERRALWSNDYKTDKETICRNVVEGNPVICVLVCTEVTSIFQGIELLDETARTTQRECEPGWEELEDGESSRSGDEHGDGHGEHTVTTSGDGHDEREVARPIAIVDWDDDGWISYSSSSSGSGSGSRDARLCVSKSDKRGPRNISDGESEPADGLVPHGFKPSPNYSAERPVPSEGGWSTGSGWSSAAEFKPSSDDRQSPGRSPGGGRRRRRKLGNNNDVSGRRKLGEKRNVPGRRNLEDHWSGGGWSTGSGWHSAPEPEEEEDATATRARIVVMSSKSSKSGNENYNKEIKERPGRGGKGGKARGGGGPSRSSYSSAAAPTICDAYEPNPSPIT